MKIHNTKIRYLLVGATAYVIEMSALFFLRRIFHFSPVSAVAISFWIGLLTAFVLQKIVTFKNHHKEPHILIKQIIGYSILVLWNYIFTLLMVKFFSNVFSVFIIRTAVILIVTIWNFAIYKHIFGAVVNIK